MKLHFKKALLPDGWSDNVCITVDAITYSISEIQTDVAVAPDSKSIDGYAVPGMTNVHSHAFQHAFAGMSEYRTDKHDSFWTWRKLMYEFLETLTPENVYEIGKELYSQMRAAGYTTVGEFHYLLHQTDGTPYDNVNEMADALINAAMESDLNICMLPVYYQRGGFDNSKLQGGQIRFGSTHDLFLKMVEKLKTDWSEHHRVRIGIALHSLRAVSIEAGNAILKEVDTLIPNCPIHIHVAEQVREIEDCLAATGKRSVEYLLDEFEVNSRWCLIHATHMTNDECRRVAKSDAVIGVCPTTEANLGDGVFMAEQYLNQNGRLAIGSDSHIAIDAWQELRTIEYAQRLTKRRRAILCTESQSCGSLLYDWTSRGGGQVCGFGNPALAIGNCNGITIIDASDLNGWAIQAANNGQEQRILDDRIFRHRLRS